MTGPVPGPPARPVPGPGPAPGPAIHALSGPGPAVDATPPGVAQALARLQELDALPVSGHVEVFDGVHRLLQDALATLDEA